MACATCSPASALSDHLRSYLTGRVANSSVARVRVAEARVARGRVVRVNEHRVFFVTSRSDSGSATTISFEVPLQSYFLFF